MNTKKQTRRRWLKTTASASLGGMLFNAFSFRAFASTNNTISKVVMIRRKDLWDQEHNLKQDVVQAMLDEAVQQLTGKPDADTAWKDIIQPDDIVGIKTNAWHYLPTPKALEQAIKSRAAGCGVQEEQISINDRGVKNDPVFQKATALINTRPMRTHAWSGVGSLLKNYIMFADSPSSYHPDSCADLATLYRLPQTKNKTRLNVLVMFTPLFHGVGTHHFNKAYTWDYNGLIVGFDPVAVDATGLRIIEAKRNEYFGEEKPLNPPAKHIQLADTRHHLGNADKNKINLVKLGWDDGCLI